MGEVTAQDNDRTVWINDFHNSASSAIVNVSSFLSFFFFFFFFFFLGGGGAGA